MYCITEVNNNVLKHIEEANLFYYFPSIWNKEGVPGEVWK